ncbi:hypothetical protein BLOT_012947 [Blomia tropicalis]|nr:hypothetical protein BLOT_012947 [Blomia tropicalis]
MNWFDKANEEKAKWMASQLIPSTDSDSDSDSDSEPDPDPERIYGIVLPIVNRFYSITKRYYTFWYRLITLLNFSNELTIRQIQLKHTIEESLYTVRPMADLYRMNPKCMIERDPNLQLATIIVQFCSMIMKIDLKWMGNGVDILLNAKTYSIILMEHLLLAMIEMNINIDTFFRRINFISLFITSNESLLPKTIENIREFQLILEYEWLSGMLNNREHFRSWPIVKLSPNGTMARTDSPSNDPYQWVTLRSESPILTKIGSYYYEVTLVEGIQLLLGFSYGNEMINDSVVANLLDTNSLINGNGTYRLLPPGTTIGCRIEVSRATSNNMNLEANVNYYLDQEFIVDRQCTFNFGIG